jgi:hypothetical protein
MSANIEQILIQKIHSLPLQQQEKVLDYVESLEKAETVNGNEIDEETKAKHERRMKLVGIGRSKSGNVSERVDEILAEGINRREGWSLP